MRDRRTKQGYKIRIYIDALRQAQNTSDEQWLQNWISGPHSLFMPRTAWIRYLERCIAREALKLSEFSGKRAA